MIFSVILCLLLFSTTFISSTPISSCKKYYKCVRSSALLAFDLNDLGFNVLGKDALYLKDIMNAAYYSGPFYDLAREWIASEINIKGYGALVCDTTRAAKAEAERVISANIQNPGQLKMDDRVKKAFIILLDFNTGKSFQKNRRGNSPACASKPQKIHVLHTNDVHAHFNQFNQFGNDCREKDIKDGQCYGGVARITHLVRTLRKKYENTLLVDAGDQFQGTLFFNIFGGSIIGEWMNEIKYDAMSIGNHEFDKGEAYLSQFLNNLTFPLLSSNIERSQLKELQKSKNYRPYTIFPKYKMAIIGYITPTTPNITNIKDIDFYNPIDSVQKTVDELHSQGIYRIICVSHNGYREDINLAKNTNGISLIVGGHSHTLLLSKAQQSPGKIGSYPTPAINKVGKTTYVVQAHRYGDYLGNVQVEFDENDTLISLSGEPILLDQSIPTDDKVASQVAEWRSVFDEKAKEVLGTIEAPRNLDISECESGECLLANLVSYAWLDWSSALKTRADFSLVNMGGLRAGLSIGPVKYEEINSLLPFGNELTFISRTGEQVMDLIESAVTRKSASGKDIYSNIRFGGLRFTYDSLTKDILVADILKNGGWERVDIAKNYTLLCGDFIANGGDNILDPLPEETEIFKTGFKDSEILMDYIRKKKIVKPEIFGLITVI